MIFYDYIVFYKNLFDAKEFIKLFVFKKNLGLNSLKYNFVIKLVFNFRIGPPFYIIYYLINLFFIYIILSNNYKIKYKNIFAL